MYDIKHKWRLGIARLSRLIGLGKNISREELNRMLDELADNSPKEDERGRRYPRMRLSDGPMAMCYRGASLDSGHLDMRFTCRHCGNVSDYSLWADFLWDFPITGKLLDDISEVFRSTTKLLAGYGLEIGIDDASLCPHCVSLEQLRIPTSATIVTVPSSDSWFRHRVPKVTVGEKVELLDWEGMDERCEIRWSTKNGEIAFGFVNKTCLGDFGYDDDREHPLKSRIDHVAWVYEGKRTPIRMQDAHLLLDLLKGVRERWTDQNVIRLREILGGTADVLVSAGGSRS